MKLINQTSTTQKEIRGLTWHNEKRKVKDLAPYKNNPRILSDFQANKLKKGLEKFNLVEIPAIDTDNKIIAGHQRIKMLTLLGRGNEEIDVRVPNRKLTKREFEEYNLASNAIQADWDLEALKSFDTDMLLNIFDENTLSHIWDDNLGIEDDEFDAEKAIEEIKEPKTKLGDVISFDNGFHRLVCGDSTDLSIVTRLVGDKKVSMLNFDYPYNIGLDYNKGVGLNRTYGSRKLNDKKEDSEYQAFLEKSLKNGLSYVQSNCHVFCWCDQRHIGLLQSLYASQGIENKRVCLWIKNSQNPTPQIAFNKAYEPCVYGTIGSPYISPNVKNLNEILNKEVGTGNRLADDVLDLFDIWLVKRLNGQEYEHPTQKPPTLYEKALRRCSKPGDIVLDLFGGSGSTLIACEQLKRRAFLSEIDPVFCDVIVARYQKLTGKEAVYEPSEK